MKSLNSKRFVPVVITLAFVGAIAAYQLTTAQGLAPDAALAAMTGASDTISQVPKLAPDFALQDVDGSIHHLSDYRGKVVMLNFWGTW